ncbi:MAG: S9 family peptidase [Candidatus Eiseniibacteriota bacterium]
MKQRPRLSLLAVLAVALPALVAAPVRADLPPLIPRDVVFGNPDRATPEISPDGTKLAYLKADTKDVLQVWVKTIGQNDDKQVTNDPKRGIRQYFWAYDNQNIIYMQDTGGDENFHVYVSNLATGETRNLTPLAGTRVIPLAYEPESPDRGLIQHNHRNKQLFDVYELNLKTGDITLVEENPGGIGGYIPNKQLEIVGRLRLKPEGGSILEWRDTPKAEWRQLVSWAPDDQFMPVEVAADGKTLYAVSDLATDTAALVAVDVKSGATKQMAHDPTADANMGMTPLVDLKTKAPLAVAFNRLRTRWQVLDPSVQKDMDGIAKLDNGDFAVMSRDLADKTWIAAFTKDDGPVKWYAWDRTAQKGQLLFSAQPRLETYTLAPMKGMEVKARDGLSLPVYLTVPQGIPAKNLPMVVYVHGGPWSRDNWGYSGTAQWLANRGYAVLQVNYRGSTGFGKNFKNAAKKEFAGKMHTDLLDAVDAVVKQGIADPKKVGIMGGSYGGYATLVGLTFTPDVFACGVDIVGPSNLATMIESFPPYWKPFLANTWYPFVGDPADPVQRKDIEARSPLFKVDQLKAPILIGQGANDPRVVQKESDQIVEALKKRGVDVEYIVFADEGHGFARPENRLKFYGASEVFLSKHLGGRAEPAPAGATAVSDEK